MFYYVYLLLDFIFFIVFFFVYMFVYCFLSFVKLLYKKFFKIVLIILKDIICICYYDSKIVFICNFWFLYVVIK